MVHNDAVRLMGSCTCPCHTRQPGECWCSGRSADPFEISHNDRIHAFGRCQCRRSGCLQRQTSPEMRRLLDELERRERDERIRSGRLRSSDVSHIARNPQKYPQFFHRP